MVDWEGYWFLLICCGEDVISEGGEKIVNIDWKL